MFSLICAWINGSVNNHEAGDLRRNRAHYDVTVMRKHVSEISRMRDDVTLVTPPLIGWDLARMIWNNTQRKRTPWYGLTLMPAWISNHMFSKVWHESTYPLPNCCAVDVWELISNFIPYFIMNVIINQDWDIRIYIISAKAGQSKRTWRIIQWSDWESTYIRQTDRLRQLVPRGSWKTTPRNLTL